MTSNNQVKITKDLANKRLIVSRNFNASPEQVWRSWTVPELLDQWWAPEPWKTETKFMNFTIGGHWLYAMVGPDQTKHWARVDFTSIEPIHSFSAKDTFCDENGNPNTELPGMFWQNTFMPIEQGTQVIVDLLFSSESDLEKIIEMGFETGFTMALNQLDQYLEIQFKIRKKLKSNSMSRVTTYLNFPGNTEEAFLFYKKVFGGEFTGEGLKRFGDYELPEGTPPMNEADKNLIIHAELSIFGNHALMATDAPESMGFHLHYGNNMHINLELESREETKRIFDELSAGGEINMPLEDMFWGAYYGSFTDKYGINWMLNCQSHQ